MGTLDQSHDMAIVVGYGAQQAGMTITDRDNPSMTELAREARRLDVNLCSLFTAADTAVHC